MYPSKVRKNKNPNLNNKVNKKLRKIIYIGNFVEAFYIWFSVLPGLEKKKKLNWTLKKVRKG